jgi:DNA polymerase III epsilon subunit family exonuclease
MMSETRSELLPTPPAEALDTALYPTEPEDRPLPASSSLAVTLSQVVVLDVETTGLDYKSEQMIELAGVKLSLTGTGHGLVIEQFASLIKPTVPIRASSQKVHGISEASLADAPPIAEVLPPFLAFIGDLPYVAHSAVTDYTFINQACKTLLGKRFTNHRIDTHDLYRSVFPDEPSHSLSALLHRFGEAQPANAHRALDDAMALARVYPRLQAMYDQKHAWHLAQIDNIHYLLERYLRLQRVTQILHGEMSDLKEVFKLHFQKGGKPIQASTGEWLMSVVKRSYEVNEAAVWDIVAEAGLTQKVYKLNARALEKLMDGRRLPEDLRRRLRETRTTLNESRNVQIVKPDADSP